MAKRKVIIENMETDVTPSPNIRLREDIEPFGEGRIAGGAGDLFIPSEELQIAGWYSPHAGLLKDMFRASFTLLSYDADGNEVDCDDC